MRLNLFCILAVGLTPLPAAARLFGQRAVSTSAHQGPLVSVSDTLRAATAEAARGLDAIVSAAARPKTTSESLLPTAGRRALVSAAEHGPQAEETLRLHWVVAPYLEDVNVALTQLGHAERFGDVAAPAQRLVTALIPIVRELQEVVTLGPRAERLWIGTTEAASELALHVAGLTKHLEELEKADKKMQRPALPPGQDLRVTWVEQKSGGAIAHLRWSAKPSLPASFETEIFRAVGPDRPRRDASLIATVDSGTRAFDDVWDGAQPESLRYFLVGKTAFGVLSEDAGEQAIGVPEYLAPPTQVIAHTARPTPQMRDFYHAAGAVTVSWHRSRSDLSGIPRAESLTPDEDAPRVERYEIYRITREAYDVVGQVSAGTETFVDVPSPQALKEGIRYAVAAVDFSERTAGGPSTGSETETLQADLSYTLALARTGMERLHADALTAGGALRILTPNVRTQAEKAWRQESAEVQAQRQRQFWAQLTDDERRKAYTLWHPTGGVEELSAGTLELLDLSAQARRDKSFDAKAETYWEALEPASQRAALLRWRESRGLSVSRTCSPWMHVAHAPAGKNLCQTDLKRFAWVEQLDPEEREPLTLGASAAVRQAEIDALDPSLKEAATHTDWPYLRRDSIQRWHADAWGRLATDQFPRALRDDVAAWAYWQNLDASSRLRLMRQAVGPVDTLLAESRYFARPLDVWLDFKLGTIVIVLCVGTGCALFLRRMRLDGL